MRIQEKSNEIELFISELNTILPNNFSEYQKNIEKKVAYERYFEKIVESIVDLTYLIIKEHRFKLPDSDKQIFDILVSERVTNEDLAENLKRAKGMRNILAHQYGSIDNMIVFNTLTKEIVDDTTEFLQFIKKFQNDPTTL